MRLVHADAIVVGDGTSIRDGAILLGKNGEIRDLGPAVDVRARSGAPIERIERLEGVLLPGLVNAHVHLELSHLRGRTTNGAGFVPWLESLQRARKEDEQHDERALERDDDRALERDAAIDRAIAQMVEHGVVGIGEVTNTLVAWRRAAKHLFCTAFHEVFAIDRAMGLALVDALDEMRDAKAPTGDDARRSLWSLVPHALYSTHPDVVRAIVAKQTRRARANEAPSMRGDDAGPSTIHLAEHPAERTFLATGKGPWRAFLDARGLAAAADAFPIAAADPISYADFLGILRADAALVHLADARPDELARVAERRCIAVLCPRSNLTIETRLPPLPAMRAAGVAVALGTDSLASTPSLDPIAEARALLDRFPDVPPSLLVQAATSTAARAIGWGDALGRLAVGTAPGVIHFAGKIPVEIDPSAWVLRNAGATRRTIARAGRVP